MSDIANLTPSARTVEITHPGTGAKLGIRVHLVSLDDERLKKVRRTITDRRLHLEARGKSFKAEDYEENRLALLSASITGWEWYNPTGDKGDKGYDPAAMPSFEGSVPEYKPVNVRSVLSKLSWFGDQINEAVAETDSFFDHSKSS